MAHSSEKGREISAAISEVGRGSGVDNHQTSVEHAARQLNATVEEVVAAQEYAQNLSLEETKQLAGQLFEKHHYPVGKAAERYLPDVAFTFFGYRLRLNPGPFNKKEHMLISIMASVGKTLPSSSLFNWIAWIAPENFNLTAITGVKKGLGFNPLPTFDWNVATHNIDPLVIPFAVTLNTFIGCFLGGITLIGLYYTNTYHTGYLPINTNSMFNHYAKSYNVSAVLDDRGWLDEEKYQAYSPVYLAASSLTMYWWAFAVYPAAVSYAIMYHRQDIALGFRSLFRGYKKTAEEFKDIHTKLMAAYKEGMCVPSFLWSSLTSAAVPEWWYAILNVFAIVLGVGAVAGWPTYTNVGVVFFGIGLALVFVIPTGIIKATTGIDVEYNYLAEFIGGAWLPGNALAMNFFKCYGYVTTAHALAFANDLKLAHYVKIPPRTTFWAQCAATLVSAFVCTGVMNFQMRNIHDICESDQKDKFTCPGVNTYFTAAVLFGSMGARKVFGKGGQYTALLSAFPVGAAVPIIFFLIQRRLPKTHWFRRAHPIPLLNGGSLWSPYNIAYMWPAVLPGWLSMVYIRRRYLNFWAKYNYVLSAALSTAIAISAVIIFFAVEYHGYAIDWWGNSPDSGCESSTCTRLKLPSGEYFGPRIGTYA
ncbi:opt oligopeptide transporter [Neofusicoccum parvum]|uniref:Opt oligopeptide transporter n=1 Tax=Neofusicoccum parvum TaxID=310453 RepID=A0ACB5SHA0_9PEZI|nr:opt oligopeptide transporter [Neofusicoccum parvum]